MSRRLKVLATEIMKKFHNSQQVIQSKEVEHKNFIKFDAYEEVENAGQSRIGSRWFMTEKDDTMA